MTSAPTREAVHGAGPACTAVAVSFFDGERIRDGQLVRRNDGALRLGPLPAPSGTPRVDGVVLGLPTDHHVHLELVDAAALEGSRLGHVIDLGAAPDRIRALAAGRDVSYAGAFLTPPGGYPSDRAWAPPGSVREIADAEAAAAAVAEMAAAGASAIKVAANSTAGPVFDDELLRTIVRLAHAAGLPAIVHAEGRGEAMRAVRAGADLLAHAPFSERLSDEEIAVHATRIEWISTLAVHEGEARRAALDNVRRFHAAGGSVRYGTDMGNGDIPVDLSTQELDALSEAGVEGTALLRTLAPADPLAADAVLLLAPGGDPARARRLSRTDTDADTEGAPDDL